MDGIDAADERMLTSDVRYRFMIGMASLRQSWQRLQPRFL